MTLPKKLIASLAIACAIVGSSGCGKTEIENATPQAPARDFATLVAGPLVRADGTETNAAALQGKTVLVYFSAHWCPPCRGFTPKLVKAYDAWKAQGKTVELVFVSFDREAEAMKEYMVETGMKWLAVPFADQSRRESLAAAWDVNGIPALVVVSPDGKTLTTDGTAAVHAKQAAALDAWLAP